MKYQEAVRWLDHAVKAFPDTAPRNIENRMKTLSRRRAKNKVAKQSRKVNRP